MITKFKTYENNNNPKIGDYIISFVDLSAFPIGDPIRDIEIFVNNNVGKLIDISIENKYKVIYNLPDEIILAIRPKSTITDELKTFHFNRHQILFWSNKKADCELFLKSKKYNL